MTDLSRPPARVNIRAILADPALRRELMVATIQATQNREGISTTRAQAEAAYDVVQSEITFAIDADKVIV